VYFTKYCLFADSNSGYCGNTLVFGGVAAMDGEELCNTPCNGNQSEMCGGPNRLSLFRFYLGNEPPSSPTTTASPSVGPIATGLPDGFEYKGCYVDGPGYRVMQNQQPDDPRMTIVSCTNACAKLGYDVAGLEYHTQCFVGQSPSQTLLMLMPAF
jgi:WSC domain